MAGALEGLKILDFTTLLPGPYATMNMADMGADVLRIVSGVRHDVIDGLPPFIPGAILSAASAQLGRNKKIIALNLKDHRAEKIIHQLLAEYDIVIEQFRPGVMAKLKLDYTRLKALNPRLIYCSLTGYGQTGPMRERAGHDINYISLSGLASYSGKKESGPSLNGMQIADVASGSNNAVIGILAAYIFRERTGKGQFIDISMTDGTMAFNATHGAAFLVDGKEPQREGTIDTGAALYDYYETKDGKYASFGGVEPQFFTAFCQTIGKPDLAAEGIWPKDCSNIKKEVREIIKMKTLDEWICLFNATDACFEPVLSLSEALGSDLAKERKMVVEVPGPVGEVRQIANPIKFSESSIEYRHVGIPTAEADPKVVLLRLGYTEKEIEEFSQTGLFS